MLSFGYLLLKRLRWPNTIDPHISIHRPTYIAQVYSVVNKRLHHQPAAERILLAYFSNLCLNHTVVFCHPQTIYLPPEMSICEMITGSHCAPFCRIPATAALCRAAAVHGSESGTGRPLDVQSKWETGNVFVAEGQQADRHVPKEVWMGCRLDNTSDGARRLLFVGSIGHTGVWRRPVGVPSYSERFHDPGCINQPTDSAGGARSAAEAEIRVRDVHHYAWTQYHCEGGHSSGCKVYLSVRQPTGATKMVPRRSRASLNARTNEQHRTG